MGKTANIKFNGGIIHTPSDVSPVDGDLNECINLVPSDGELKPIEMPTMVFPAGGPAGVLAAVHNGTWGKNFIKVRGRDVLFFDSNMQPIEPQKHSVESNVQWVETIGSTLVIGTEKSIHYALYKNGAYKWLGDVLPRPVFDCYMDTGNNEAVSEPVIYRYESEEEGYVEGVHVIWRSDVGQYTYRMVADNTETKRNISENIKSKYAALYGKTRRNNKFVYPFFIRYATRLYDGSYINHSSPVLMLPSTNVSPIATLLEPLYGGGPDTDICNIVLRCNAPDLKFRFDGYLDENNNPITDISDWQDIIKGVDMFMSGQFPTSDTTYYDDLDKIPGFVTSCLDAQLKPLVDLGSGYFGNEKYELNTIRGLLNSFQYSIGMPSFPNSNYSKTIAENAIFYMAKQYDMNELDGWGGAYRSYADEVDYGYLENLETKRVLPDEYLSRSKKGSLAHYSYNRRLMLGGLNIEAPLWYPITETHYNQDYALDVEICFEIEKPDNNIHIRSSVNNVSKYRFGHFLYYPDIDCKKAIVKMTYLDKIWNQTTVTYLEVPMEQHNGLNGAFALMPDLESLYEHLIGKPYANQQLPQQSSDRYYQLSNNLIISIVSNPFVFDIEKSMEIGNGTIMALNTIVVPMTNDKYGGNNLVVFTDQGIFAPAIDTEGAFSGNVPPVSSADTIMNIPRLGQPNVISDGQCLYFITKRGLMEMRGLQVRCVSEVLNGVTWDSRDYGSCVTLSQDNMQYNNIVTMLKNSITDRKTFNQTVNDGDAFLAFDYKHNRIIVTDPECQAHWFYSIADRKWGKLVFNDDYKYDDNSFVNIANIPAVRGGRIIDGRHIVSAVFNWNESYIQTENGEIWDLMGAPDENDDKYYKYGFIASRPIRLGSDDYKSMTRILHRKQIDTFKNPNSFLGMHLYGSTDGLRYYEITSMRGASYKYFVVLLYICMKANERYSYLSVEFEERFQNKLR